jgi:uncharacterized protein
MPLCSQEIDRIEDILFSDVLNEDALDYFGLHGLVSAIVVGPPSVSADQALRATLGGEVKLSNKQTTTLIDAIETIAKDLADSLTEGSDFNLPFEEEDEDYEVAMESWCVGFIEGMLLKEDAWFAKDEEVSAELLLPYMALSGLYDGDEFHQIHDNSKLMQQMIGLLGEQLTDIYLFFHSD